MWLIDTGITGASSVTGLDMIMESSLIAAETAELAAALHGDTALRALAREGNVGSIRALSSKTAGALDAAVARIGHRGWGEAELSSPVFGDDPAMLLTAAAQAAAAVEAAVTAPTPTKPTATPARRLAANARGSRELAHDTTLRFTHELRMTLRELGSRRVAADLIDVVDDVYYLTCDELVTMPADARLRIKRRRAERERLQVQRPPDVIDGAWAPVEASTH
jgi:hypothetical protein